MFVITEYVSVIYSLKNRLLTSSSRVVCGWLGYGVKWVIPWKMLVSSGMIENKNGLYINI